MTGEEHTCQASVPVRPGLWMQCGLPATHYYLYGCLHEHVKQAWTCGVHTPQAEMVGCQACFDAGHECPMSFQELPVTAG